jgi:hypothetical protein
MAGNPWESSLPIHDDLTSTRRAAAMIHLSLSKDNQFLAACCGSIGSLTIFDTIELVPIHRGSAFQKNLAINSTLTAATALDTQTAHSLNTHHSTTSSTPFSSTSSASLTNIGNPSTCVRGVIFCLEKSDRSVIGDENTLLIITDKNFISISIPVQVSKSLKPAAVLESSYAVTLSSDDVSWRRIEGGVRPVSGVITRDHPTGLVFMAIRRSGGETRPEEPHYTPFYGDALAIVGVTCRRLRDPKTLHLVSRLSLTPMQVITDLPGDRNLLSLIPCGPASNKILAADHTGCISVWYLREDRIENLKSKTVFQVAESPIEEFIDQQGQQQQSEGAATSEIISSSVWVEQTQTDESPKKVNLEHDFDDELEQKESPESNPGNESLDRPDSSSRVAVTVTHLRETVHTLFEDSEQDSQDVEEQQYHQQAQVVITQKEKQRQQQFKSQEESHRKSTASSRLQQKEKRSRQTQVVKDNSISTVARHHDEASSEESHQLSAPESPPLELEEGSRFHGQILPALPSITMDRCGAPGRLLAQEILVSPSLSEERLLVTSNKTEVLFQPLLSSISSISLFPSIRLTPFLPVVRYLSRILILTLSSLCCNMTSSLTKRRPLHTSERR